MNELRPKNDFDVSFDGLSKLEIQAFIAKVENAAGSGEPIDIPINHHFSKDVYAREMVMPKGSLVVGKIHRHENLCIISQGEVSVLSIDGVKRLKAPCTFVASRGAKRVIYAHEETVWTVIHGTNERDLEKLEHEFIAKDYEDLYLRSQRGLLDVLEALGSNEAHLRLVSDNENDLVEFPCDNILIKESPIEGLGVFAARDLRENIFISKARIEGKRTPAGRYSNHSGTPNAKMVMIENGDVDLVATKDIKKDDEILTDYYFNYVNTRSLSCHG